jgi:acetyltransferase-like isoleucine patch superfamily enzyme
MKFLIIKIHENAILRMSVVLSTLIACFRLWLHSCHCGKNVKVDGSLVVQCRRKDAIRIGNHVSINSRFRSNLVGLTQPTVLCAYGEGTIKIGDHVGISGAILSARKSITIGDHVTIGGNARIFDHDFHSLTAEHRRDGKTDRENVKSASVVIEDDVFIGTNAMILKGVHIGARSIIGAGAVVALKEIPADSIVAGNPARIVSKSKY